MSDSIIHKFNGVLEDASLQKFGSAVFTLPNIQDAKYADNELRIYASQVNESFVHADGGTFQIVGSGSQMKLTDRAVLAWSEKWADNAVYPDADSWTQMVYTISNIYNIMYLDMGTNVTMTKGIASLFDYGILETFILRGGSIDIGKCRCGTLEHIECVGTSSISGDWADVIENNPDLTILFLANCSYPLPQSVLSSSIQTLAGFSGDLSLLPVTIYSVRAADLTGSIDDYVERLRVSGRTTGNIQIIAAQNSIMTLNGKTMAEWCADAGITPVSLMWIVWGADSISITTTNPN